MSGNYKTVILVLVKCNIKFDIEPHFFSVYADINELKLDLKLSERKSSENLNLTTFADAFTPSKYSRPPNLPPRSSLSSDSLSPESKSNIFTKPDNLQFRRRSDFGSSEINAIPAQQFATIFECDLPQARRKSDSSGILSTQFKLNSMTQV